MLIVFHYNYYKDYAVPVTASIIDSNKIYIADQSVGYKAKLKYTITDKQYTSNIVFRNKSHDSKTIKLLVKDSDYYDFITADQNQFTYIVCGLMLVLDLLILITDVTKFVRLCSSK